MDNIKQNLQYFSARSMKDLFLMMTAWQETHQKRLHSTTIHQDNGEFCCIALTNPTEVVITSADGRYHAGVGDGYLYVN